MPAGLEFPRPLTLHESAALLGAYRWVEHNLYALTGSWVQGAEDPEIRLHLDLVSGEHGWHAELWEDRLPVLDGVDPVALTRPLGPALEVACTAVPTTAAEVGAAHRGTPSTVLHLAALCRFLVPRLLATYENHLGRAVPATDGPTIRILRIVVRDELESWQSGERLLQARLATADDVRAVAELQAALEGVVVGTGVAPGLIPWPDAPPPAG